MAEPHALRITHLLRHHAGMRLDGAFTSLLKGLPVYNGMKVAKPSPRDLDAALDLLGLLDAISRDYYPTDPSQPDDDAPTFIDHESLEHLQHVLQQLRGVLDKAPGFQGRVLFGAAMLMDPRNRVLNPDLDYIALHPRLGGQRAEVHYG